MSLSPSRSVRGRMITGCLPTWDPVMELEHQMLGSSAQLFQTVSSSITMRRGEG